MMESFIKIISIVTFMLFLGACSNSVKEYHKNGNIKVIGYTVDGKPHGQFTEFSYNGDTTSILLYDHGALISRKSFFENRLDFKDIFDSNGYTRLTYYVDGVISSRRRFVDDVQEGRYIGYYNSGEIKNEINFKDGSMVGEVRQYYPSGVLQVHTQDAESGIYSYFDSLGNCIKKIKYNNYYPSDTVWISD